MSHVVISSNTPPHKLQVVYSKICAGITTPTENHALKSIIDTWIYSIENRMISTGIYENDSVLADMISKEIESVLKRNSRINSGLAAVLRTYYKADNSGDFATSQATSGWISGEQTIGRIFKSVPVLSSSSSL
jgi:adenosylhomocysteinase